MKIKTSWGFMPLFALLLAARVHAVTINASSVTVISTDTVIQDGNPLSVTTIPAVPPAPQTPVAPELSPGPVTLATGEVLLDGFETQQWQTSKAEGASLNASLVPGRTGQALKVEYDLRGPGQWVSVLRDIPVTDFRGKELQYHYKIEGSRTDYIEVRLISDNGSVYSNTHPLVVNEDWTADRFHYDSFSYQDGDVYALGPVKRIQFIISGDEGSRKAVYLDDLRLVP